MPLLDGTIVLSVILHVSLRHFNGFMITSHFSYDTSTSLSFLIHYFFRIAFRYFFISISIKPNFAIHKHLENFGIPFHFFTYRSGLAASQPQFHRLLRHAVSQSSLAFTASAKSFGSLQRLKLLDLMISPEFLSHDDAFDDLTISFARR
jgi:hypothetical protein